ncbi:hypothetical protein LTR62_008825 [Meristemomyces frigidus]|uniref:Uncharacterized protein n=1 Tax=Meristemomyces frigidus TaxID=1508187 RepID=A0AAN7TAA0_9PEZI|nr:hypothetical protein LTR62_008825 [Meristemomyces frigidus]
MSLVYDDPLAYSPWNESNDEGEPSTAPKPLSGPGTSRQTRRLQLRNAGFRAAAVPARKVTPKSVSSSTMAWSANSGPVSGSDAENVSPMGVKYSSAKMDKRRSSGVLQEIDSGSNTLTRPKASRPRITSRTLFAPPAELYTEDVNSPPAPKSTIRAKSMRARAKMNKTRRSVSGETRMYIDHLEAELEDAQEKLRVVNSPTVTRQQSSKMRALDGETKHLQEELDEWEAKYDQRIREVMDEHLEIETNLRAQLRRLEQDAEESRYRLQELEIEVAATREAIEASEAANVHLEKRLEIMSDILATSPTKIDLHAITPGMHKKHQRPKSMLPRFPTASNIHMSPEKQPRTQPPSPMLTFADFKNGLPETLDTSLSQSDMLSDAESVFSEAPTNGGSVTSTEQVDLASFNPWTLHAIHTARARPARRMRRFGPGSHGPKPFILPSTSSFEPVSAPALERSETAPYFSFPLEEEVDVGLEEGSPSSLLVRRRASTTADQTTLDHLAASSFLQRPASSSATPGGSTLSVQCPNSVRSGDHGTPRNFASLGSVAGRNLMDELYALDTTTTVESCEDSSKVDGEQTLDGAGDEEQADEAILSAHDSLSKTSADVHSHLSTETMPLSTTEVDDSPPPSDLFNPTYHSSHHNASPFTRLRLLFTDLWRSPLALTQHLVHSAQARMRLPRPLRNVQWWLVGALLGPMARERLLRARAVVEEGEWGPCRVCANDELERQGLLQGQQQSSDTAGLAESDSGFDYGTFPPPPLTSPKQRSGQTSSVHPHCPHTLGLRPATKSWSRHNPWLWLKFSLTLVFAVGVAFKEGPASLLRRTVCGGCRREQNRRLVGEHRGGGEDEEADEDEE